MEKKLKEIIIREKRDGKNDFEIVIFLKRQGFSEKQIIHDGKELLNIPIVQSKEDVDKIKKKL